MRNFRIEALVRCNCCNMKSSFANNFSAADQEEAVEMAKSKFIMIRDDLLEEFKGEGHDIVVEITSCQEL